MAGIIERVETWDLYGTGSYPPAPYLISGPGGGGAGHFTLMSISAPPWNPSGMGTFVRCSGGSASNQGPGICLPPWTMRRDGIIGYWFRIINYSTGGTTFGVRANNSGDSSQTGGLDCFAPEIDSTGHWTVDGITASSAMSLSTWYFVEVYCKAGDANGGSPAYQQGAGVIALNGSIVLTDSNASANQGTPYCFDTWALDFETFDSTGTAMTYDFGPLYTMNPNGGGAGSFLGPLFMGCFLPTSDSAKDFTPSTGSSNYALVNSSPPGSDFNKDSARTKRDLFTFPSTTFTGFKDVRAIINAKCATPSGRMAGGIVKSGGVVGHFGGAGPWGIAGASGYQYIVTPAILNDPNTGLPWASPPTLAGYEVLE